MPRKIRELQVDLRKAGFASRPGKGDHTVWQHPDVPRATVVLDGQDGDDAKPYQERDLRRAFARTRAEQGRKR